MSSILSRLNLKRKLILFATIPLMLLPMLCAVRMLDLLDSYQASQTNTQAIHVTQQIESLIFELQKENGLMSGYIANQGQLYRQRLLQQYPVTDQQVDQLLANDSLLKFSKLLQIVRQDDHAIAGVVFIEQLKSQLNRLRLYAEKQQATRDTLFYSDTVHHLLGLISQLQMQTENADQAAAYNSLINMLEIQSLASKERNLMHALLSKNHFDIDTYTTMSDIEFELAKKVEHTLPTMDDNHRALLNQIWSSPANQQLHNLRRNLMTQVTLIKDAKELDNYLGYGGLIHHFKNYLLRGDQQNFNLFLEHSTQLEQKLSKMSQLPNITAHQRELITQIGDTVNLYHAGIMQLLALKNAGLSLSEQDQSVKVDDTPLLDALARLQHQTPIVESQTWWTLASQHIEQLALVSQSITDDIAVLSQNQKHLALFYLAFSIAATLINLLMLTFVGKFLLQDLHNNITQIVNATQKMAQNPKLELTVPVNGTDEIAQIANALNTMLKERQKANKQIERAAAVFEFSAEGIIVTDKDNRIELVNPAFTQITGYTLDDVKGLNPSILNAHQQSANFYTNMWAALSEKNKWEGEIWNKRKNGQIYPEYLSITVVRNNDGDITQHIGLFLDISNHKKYEQDIWYKTNYDTLTNLPNSNLFFHKLEQAIALAKQENQSVTLLFVDLDKFKYTNDMYGHDTGNQVLKLVAARLEAIVGENDFLARLNSDEFVIMMPNPQPPQAVTTLAEQIITHLSSPFDTDQHQLHISASIGISQYPGNAVNAESLTLNAETAMHHAKQDGRNSYRHYSADMNENLVAEIELEQNLRRAVLQQEFTLHYQPIVNLETEEILGVEALIRWLDPKLGSIPPDKFIPIAEESGLIRPIGEWVLQQALTDLAHWHSMGFAINLAINVSGRQLLVDQQKPFHGLLNGLLQKHEIDPSFLHIEITESILLNDTAYNLQELEAIRALGVDIYIDDFGTGYSSLSYLKRFPISTIKIDKGFVDNMFERQSDANLVKAIVMMGKSLELELVAEGIETQAQKQFLQELGCDYGQGYLFSKPLTSAALVLLLQSKLKVSDEHPPIDLIPKKVAIS